MQYYVNLPALVLAVKDNHQPAVTIQAGTTIEVIGPVESDDRFLLIRAGKFHIFASDLASRAGCCPRDGAGLHGGESRTRTENEAPLHKARARASS